MSEEQRFKQDMEYAQERIRDIQRMKKREPLLEAMVRGEADEPIGWGIACDTGPVTSYQASSLV